MRKQIRVAALLSFAATVSAALAYLVAQLRFGAWCLNGGHGSKSAEIVMHDDSKACRIGTTEQYYIPFPPNYVYLFLAIAAAASLFAVVVSMRPARSNDRIGGGLKQE